MTAPGPPDIDLFSKSSLCEFLRSADIRLLRAEWLLQASDAELLLMRQELPDEAFVPFEELSLGTVNSRSIWPLSYAWQSAAHPDPHGIIARAMRTILGQFNNFHRASKVAIFWDHKCLFQRKMHPEYDPKKGHQY